MQTLGKKNTAINLVLVAHWHKSFNQRLSRRFNNYGEGPYYDGFLLVETVHELKT